MDRVTRACYISLHFVANPANCFAGICSSSLVNNLKPSRANTERDFPRHPHPAGVGPILNRVVQTLSAIPY